MALVGHIECIIDEDGLKADLRFNTNETGPKWDVEAVKKLLSEKRVVEGFSNDTIKAALDFFAKTNQFPATYTVANGVPPVFQEPESIEWEETSIPDELAEDAKRVLAAAPPPVIEKIRTEKVKKKKIVDRKPKLPFMATKQEEITVTETREVRESVSIDPEVIATGWIEEGALVAKITPSVPGKPGQSVFGQPIQSTDKGDNPLYPGKGIEEAKNELHAAWSGFIRRGSNWVEVIPFHSHSWSIEQSKDKTTYYLIFKMGDELASLPSGEVIRQAAEEAGAEPERLNSKESIDRLLFDYLGSGKKSFRIPLTVDRDSLIEIAVTPDKLMGYLRIRKGSGSGKPLVLKEVGAAIKASGFKGMNLEKIKNDLLAFYKGEEEELSDYLLAEGKAPTSAGARTLECRVPFFKSSEIDEIKERAGRMEESIIASVESTANWPISEVQKMAYVREGVVIATISQAGKGSDGIDIYGKPIPSKKGTELSIELYEGLQQDDSSVVTTSAGILDCSEADGKHRLRVRPHTDSHIKVTISADRMSAFVDLTRSEGTGSALTKERVMEAISANGITKGIDYDAVDNAVQTALEEGQITAFQIASGEPPLDPPESSIRLLIHIASHKHVTIDNSGKANYKNQDIITTVEEGTRIAEIQSSEVKPKDGWDVTGKTIAAKRSQISNLETGANIRKEEEVNIITLIAGSGGELFYDGKRMEIKDTHIEEGDVSLNNGNIKFPGSVDIKGNVQTGFYVLSGKDIRIGQSIDGALLSADGSIFIGQGVKGGGKAVLRAKKDIAAGFIEHATVLAVGDLKAKKSCFNCRITSNGWVRIPEGNLVGGVIKARKGIETKDLGSERGVETSLSFGQDYLMENQIAAEEREIQKLRTKIVKLDSLMAKIEKQSEKEKGNLVHVRKEKVKMLKAIEKRSVRLFTFREKFEEHFPSEIIIHGTVYPGVIIECHGRMHEINEKKSNLKISFDSAKGHILEQPFSKD